VHAERLRAQFTEKDLVGAALARPRTSMLNKWDRAAAVPTFQYVVACFRVTTFAMWRRIFLQNADATSILLIQLPGK
jgi:hypothetical protein